MKCEICGKSKGRIYGSRNKFGKILCGRHYAQISNHGRILDRTVRDKNEILIKEKFAVIKIYRENDTLESLIDIEDVGFVSQYKWSIDGNGYLMAHKLNKSLHTLLVKSGIGEVVDHENQNKLDNRKSNLRVTTKSVNAINSKMNTNNKTGFKGVFYNKSKDRYISYLTIHKKRVNLGSYLNLHDAVVARLKGELEHFKENSPQRHLFEEYGIGEGK